MGRQQLHHLEVRDRVLRRVGVERAAVGSRRSRPIGASIRPRPRARAATDEREVLALEPAPLHERPQALVRLLAARDDDQPGRVAVEAVDDPRPLGIAAGERPASPWTSVPVACPAPGWTTSAGRLVDDEQVLVLVRDPQVERLGLRDRRRLRRVLGELDLLPAGEPVALGPRPPSTEHGAGGEQPLGRRARADPDPARKRSSRSPAADSGTRRGRDTRRRGPRSAATRAPSRIATPITMKLSARLNAGQ